MALLMASCASLPQQVERIPSQALANPEATTLGKIVAAARPPDATSGFQLLPLGDDAFEARVTLADRAERTLDLQYYIIRHDPPTRALFGHIRKAAARGVRVRLLIDDLDTAGRDEAFANFSALPNVQVRVFNPFAGGREGLLSRFLTSVHDLRRLNRRMHNKLFIADNALGITGGRNLGAEYFVRKEDVNFADLDVLAAGQAVRELSATFDAYWNSMWAYPVEAFAKPSQAKREASPASDEAEPESPPSSPRSLNARLKSGDLKLVWAPSKVLVDRPEKVAAESEPGNDTIILDDIARIMARAKGEVLIITPYLVPGKSIMALFAGLRAKNIRVRILTNSLATTDVPAVHAAYSRYRRELLKLGVELYELRPMPTNQRGIVGSIGSSRASLHAKAIVVDKRVLFVGSMNLDPRSTQQNTEIGLVIASPVLGKEASGIFDQGVTPEDSYRLELSPRSGSIEWVTRTDKGEERLSSEPEAGFWRGLMNNVFRLAAPEDLL